MASDMLIPEENGRSRALSFLAQRSHFKMGQDQDYYLKDAKYKSSRNKRGAGDVSFVWCVCAAPAMGEIRSSAFYFWPEMRTPVGAFYKSWSKKG